MLNFGASLVKTLSKLRDPTLARRVATYVQTLTPRYNVRVCHVCGTHEWTITRYGLRTLLPENVEVLAGPGCPVCVVPSAEIDEAIWLARKGKVVVTFGDMFRVPGSQTSLREVKAAGGDVRIVYSMGNAVKMCVPPG